MKLGFLTATLFGAFSSIALAQQGAITPTLGTTSQTACAIKAGALWCWGANAAGQVGIGYTSSVITEPQMTIPATTPVTSVGVGGSHVCAVAKGALLCWGENDSGQLGDGTTDDQLYPKTIIASGVSQVTAGTNHTCAIVGGKAKCWGGNSAGQVGDGSTTPRLTPVFVKGSIAATQIRASSYFTCALSGASVKCWGDNTTQQLGFVTTDPYSSSPVNTIAAGATTVEVGYKSACAIVTEAGVTGVLKCWGDNGLDKFGSSLDSTIDTPATVSAWGVTSVKIADYHMCFIRGTGLWCGGQNESGEFGNGDDANATDPMVIQNVGVTALQMGMGFTCVVSRGVPYCSGSNYSGQLANGSSGDFSLNRVELNF